MTFALVKLDEGASAKDVCAAIRERTGLEALPRSDFSWKTMSYYLRRTSIPQNFGITIALGFIVGCAIAGQTFFSFVQENQNQYGALKAMGVTNWTIVRMVLLQAFVVGSVGFCLGQGLACLFGAATQGTQISFFMPWQVPVITAVSIVVIVLLATAVSLGRVLRLEPAIVFKG